MKIAIDATNIKAGGGLTHLKRIVENYLYEDVQFELIKMGENSLQLANENYDTKTIFKNFITNI